MADIAPLLLAIHRGEYDPHLGDIAQSLAQRQLDLTDQQLAAALLAAYVQLTDVSVDEMIASLQDQGDPDAVVSGDA